MRDLGRNFRYFGWPIPVVFAAWIALSSWGLDLAERGQHADISGYGDALFYTFMAMFGENIAPVTVAGRVLYVLDALSGLVLLGLVVWFITISFEPEGL